MARGRRLWMKLETATGPLPVYVTKRPLVVESGEVQAYYDPVKHEIVINLDAGAHRVPQIFLHELLHRALDDMPVELWSVIFQTDKLEERSAREELLVGFLENVFYDLVFRNRILRIPKPPDIP